MVDFGEQLRVARKNRGLSLRALAALLGTDYRRLSALERGARRATPSELSVLSSFFDISFYLPPRPRPSPQPQLYVRAPEPARDFTPCLARLRSAKKHHAALYGRFQGLIWPHRHFLHRYPTDSVPEVFLPLSLLKAAFNTGDHSLLRLGFRQLAVTDRAGVRQFGDVPHPALWRRGFVCLPQVTLQTRRGPFRVDCLVRFQDGRYRRWMYLELDGPHHNPDRDREREEALEMPVVRFKEADFFREDFVEWLLQRIERACRTTS